MEANVLRKSDGRQCSLEEADEFRLGEAPDGFMRAALTSFSQQGMVDAEEVDVVAAGALSDDGVALRMSFAGPQMDGHFLGPMVEVDVAVPEDGVGRKVPSAICLKRKKLIHDSEESDSRADEEAGKVLSASIDGVEDHLANIVTKKSMEFPTRSTFLAAAKNLLNGRFKNVRRAEKDSGGKADVATVLLEGRSHLEGRAERDDHICLKAERITMRKE